MKYTPHTKCTFISNDVVIFDVSIHREYYFNGESDIVSEINIIFYEDLSYNHESITKVNPKLDNIKEIQLVEKESIELCIKRAKWIFNKKAN